MVQENVLHVYFEYGSTNQETTQHKFSILITVIILCLTLKLHTQHILDVIDFEWQDKLLSQNICDGNDSK